MKVLAQCNCQEPTRTNLKNACGVCGGFNVRLEAINHSLISSARIGMKNALTKKRILRSALNPMYD
jgi:hypothetical protein